MKEDTTNLSTDMAVTLGKKFFRTMAQPLDNQPMGVSLWNEQQVQKNAALDSGTNDHVMH
jgi:DNA excision repair protein ERCC-2